MHANHDNVPTAKNVFLLGMEEETVKFVEVDPDIDMFDVRKYPIFYSAQTDLVRRVIVTPRAKILDLEGNMEVEERNVVWLCHPGRCGSTVWSQVFAVLPNWKIISESRCMIYTLLQS